MISIAAALARAGLIEWSPEVMGRLAEVARVPVPDDMDIPAQTVPVADEDGFCGNWEDTL